MCRAPLATCLFVAVAGGDGIRQQRNLKINARPTVANYLLDFSTIDPRHCFPLRVATSNLYGP